MLDPTQEYIRSLENQLEASVQMLANKEKQLCMLHAKLNSAQITIHSINTYVQKFYEINDFNER